MVVTLNLEDWLVSIAGIIIIIFTLIFSIYLFYQARKNNAKLLYYFGLASIGFCLVYIGTLWDFLSILLTGENFDNWYFFGVFCYMWQPISLIPMIYIGLDLLLPEKKKPIILIYIILGIIFEIFLFFFAAETLIFKYPSETGKNVIYFYIRFNTPAFWIQVILAFSFFLINGLGLTIKGHRTSGQLKKKYLYLGIASIIIFFLFLIDANESLYGFWKGISRIGYIFCFVLMYVAIREEKIDEKPVKKEVQVEKGLFRMSRIRPDNLTEEEIMISKDKKVCLVCKNVIAKVNYLCSDCGAFYCIKCMDALTESENACWVCSEPFDESKPSKPFEKAEEEIELELSGKFQKSHKSNKKLKKEISR